MNRTLLLKLEKKNGKKGGKSNDKLMTLNTNVSKLNMKSMVCSVSVRDKGTGNLKCLEAYLNNES